MNESTRIRPSAQRPGDDPSDSAVLRIVGLFWLPLVFVVGWIAIGRTPFWVDESIAVLPARGILSHGVPIAPFDLDFMPWQIERGLWDPATPLYRYVLSLVFGVFGFSETVARGFSWVVGFCCLIPIFAVGRRLFGLTAAWLGILWIAGSPTFGLFAREARHFTLVMFFGVTMIWALLLTARDEIPDHRRLLWVVPLVGALLTQTIGYLALPVAAVFIILNGPRRFIAKDRGAIAVATFAVAVYVAVMAMFWHTLPFFHDVGCHNRPAGCRPDWFYYLAVLWDLLTPMTERFRSYPAMAAGIGVPMFLLGTFALLRRGARVAWPNRTMVWVWLLVPLILLSTREVKFFRFLFQWTFPVAVLISAFGVVWGIGRIRGVRTRRIALILAFVIGAIGMQWNPQDSSGSTRSGWSSGLRTYLKINVWGAPSDNWEFLAAKGRYLRDHVGDRDVIVTSFDDAGLGYYAGQFVYGFLNSRRDDAFFMNLLAEAEELNHTVWFVDTLPQLDFCFTDEPEPQSIECREKYPRFYQACTAPQTALESRCHRITVAEVTR